MSDVEFYGENESGTRFVPQKTQQRQGQASGRGMVGMIMRWLGIKNEAVANHVLIIVAVLFFIVAIIVFVRT